MKTAWKLCVAAVCLLAAGLAAWTLNIFFTYRVEPDWSNLEELTNHWLSRGDEVQVDYQLRFYEPVEVGDLVYVPMEVGQELQLGYVRLEEGPNGKYKLAGTGRTGGSFSNGVIQADGKQYLMFLGRNRFGEIASARFHWDGGYEYEDAIPPEGYTCELDIPWTDVFLVHARVEDKIPADMVSPEDITLYDAQGQDISDSIDQSGSDIR